MSHSDSKFQSLARTRYIGVMSTMPTCSARGTEEEERIEKGEEEEGIRSRNLTRIALQRFCVASRHLAPRCHHHWEKEKEEDILFFQS